MSTTVKFKVGDEVEWVDGEGRGHAGRIVEKSSETRVWLEPLRGLHGIHTLERLAAIEAGWGGHLLGTHISNLRPVQKAPSEATDLPPAAQDAKPPRCPDFPVVSVPYSSMVSEESLRHEVRKQLTAGLREWPRCKRTGEELEIKYGRRWWVTRDRETEETTDLIGNFHCPTCEGEG